MWFIGWLRRDLRKIFIAGGTVLFLLLIIGFGAGPGFVESRLNRVGNSAAREPQSQSELHSKLQIADLHADSLLWDRDLLRRGSRGHVDVPRLIEGNVAVQAFTVVTKVPSKDGKTDRITQLAMLQRWPAATWSSLRERALYQASRLHEFAEESSGRLVVIRSQKDLGTFLERRAAHPQRVAAFLGLEGAHALEGNVKNLDDLYDAGYRMIGIAHFFDNEFGGSSYGANRGLTPLGRELIREMEQRRIIVDLAHASPKTIDDVLAMATRPVLVSHTGVQGTCKGARNLSDEHLRKIAANGGIIGIGFWPGAVCGNDVQSIVRAIRHVVRVTGVSHAALGSDFDGDTTVPFDAAGLAQLTAALQAGGFTETEIRQIMGENALRFLAANLP